MSVIPFTDFLFVSRKKYFWYRESLEYFWTWIVWIFFFPSEFYRKRFFQKRLFADNSRNKSDNTINPYKTREFSTWEYIFSDWYFCDIKKLKYALIYAFIMSADNTILTISFSIFLSRFLCVNFSSRRKINNLHFSILFLYFSKGVCEWFHSDDSASSSTIWMIINSSCITNSPVGEIMYKIMKEPLFLGSFHYTGIEIGFYTLWEKRKYMKGNHIILYQQLQHQRRGLISLDRFQRYLQ